jgi:hypothetical protein
MRFKPVPRALVYLLPVLISCAVLPMPASGAAVPPDVISRMEQTRDWICQDVELEKRVHPDTPYVGPLPPVYSQALAMREAGRAIDPCYPMGEEGLFYQVPLRLSFPWWLPAAIFAALGPVCLLLLRKSLKGHRCYHALMAIALWWAALAAAAATGWAHGKTVEGSEMWIRLFDRGQYFVPTATCILVLLCLVFRPLLYRSLAVFALAYTVATGGPYLWAERLEAPHVRARQSGAAEASYRFATDGLGNLLLVSRGPDGEFDATDEALLAAVHAQDAATTPTLGIDWEAVKDCLRSPASSGGAGDLMFGGTVAIDYAAQFDKANAEQAKIKAMAEQYGYGAYGGGYGYGKSN